MDLQENSYFKNAGNYNCFYFYDSYEELLHVKVLVWFENVFKQPVGLLGNPLVIAILWKKTFRNSSTAVIFTFLLSSDIAAFKQFGSKLSCFQ